MTNPAEDKLLQYRKQAQDLGQSKRQSILDMIKSGKTLGEVSKFFALDLMIVCEVLTQNIKNISYLGDEAI